VCAVRRKRRERIIGALLQQRVFGKRVGGERERVAREEGRERVSERERGTMSYPNEHVASKTLSSCSVPRNSPNHVDYVVRRSRRTDPRCACAAPRSYRCKVEQSRAITTSWYDDDGTDLIALIRQTELGREINAPCVPDFVFGGHLSTYKFTNFSRNSPLNR
jgi:hypothetical protein